MFEKVQRLDDVILDLISSVRTPVFDRIIVIITSLGNNSAIWLCIALPFLFSKNKRMIGLRVVIALGFAVLIGEVFIKHMVRRPRPCKFLNPEEMLIGRPGTYSFPSGHTISSFAAAYILASHYYSRQNLLAFMAIVLIFVLAAAISFSRLYLRVHYPSDVLAGTVLGLICGFCVIKYVPI